MIHCWSFIIRASAVVALVALPNFSRAAVEMWTIDSSRSQLTLTAILGEELLTQPQTPGSNVAAFGGTVLADRTFDGFDTFLEFNGGSQFDALAHPDGPFTPNGINTVGDEDNYGVFVEINDAILDAAVRDLVFDISGGTATVGQTNSISVRPTAGSLNHEVSDGAGATFQFLDVFLDQGINGSAQPLTLDENIGGREVLTIPFEVPYMFQLREYQTQATFTGQIVATRGVLGDYGMDGGIGPEDYDVWVSAFGTTDPAADGNGDGIVDAADYTVWRDGLAILGGAAMQRANGVPEPTGVALVVIGSICMSIAQRRRHP